MAYTPKKFSALVSATLPLDGTEAVVLIDKKTTTKSIANIALHRPIATKVADYTVVLADADSLILMNVATANNFTIPPNSSVAFASGTRLSVCNYGAGITTVVAGAGVTVRCAKTLALRAQYSVAELIKVGADEWVLSGDLT